MNTLRISLLNAIVVGALLPFSASLSSGADSSSSTLGTAPVRAGSTKVSVFFGEKKALSIEEIKTQAKELLKAKGYQIEDSFHCAINIGVVGKDPGCSVMFQDLSGAMLYVVAFNAKGEPALRQAGPVRHGIVPFRGPGSLPEGRKVKADSP
jgi:hypothetical protein